MRLHPDVVRGIVAIAMTCIACLAVIMTLGHYFTTPLATALLGVSIGSVAGGRRYLRRHRELERGHW